MVYPTVYLAAEDAPGLAVGRKLIAEAEGLSIYREENARGNTGLRRRISSYQNMANYGLPVLLLTDLDILPCAPELVQSWLKPKPCVNLLFRVCVREVEAWLMGDRKGMAALLRIPEERLASEPEILRHPKSELIKLAQRSPARIRKAVTPIGTSGIGPGYNDLLEDFISHTWSAEVAAKSCPSLKETRDRIAELAHRVAGLATE